MRAPAVLPRRSTSLTPASRVFHRSMSNRHRKPPVGLMSEELDRRDTVVSTAAARRSIQRLERVTWSAGSRATLVSFDAVHA